VYVLIAAKQVPDDVKLHHYKEYPLIYNVTNFLLGKIMSDIYHNYLVTGFLNSNALDEMGSRIEELEQNINELRAEIGLESSPPPVTEREKSPLRELKPEIENP